jgi:hypothetical protein
MLLAIEARLERSSRAQATIGRFRIVPMSLCIDFGIVCIVARTVDGRDRLEQPRPKGPPSARSKDIHRIGTRSSNATRSKQ